MDIAHGNHASAHDSGTGNSGWFGGSWWSGALVWAGIAGAAALLALDLTAPAPRLDVLGCLALALLGVLAYRRQAERRYERAVRLPPAAPSQHPPRTLRLGARWPVANSRLLVAATWAALAVPVVLASGWALASTEDSADVNGALARGGSVAAVILLWSWGARRMTSLESRHVADQVVSAVDSGVARVLPVTVTGWSAGVHRPTPPGATPVGELAAARGRPIGRKAGQARTPRRQAALRLAVPGLGERALFLDHRVPAQALATALDRHQGWLYWVPSGVPGDPSWSTPALLALGDGRYVQGWTQLSPDAPDGPELGTVQTSPGTASYHPPELAVLRRTAPFRPLLALHALALLLAATALTGVWDDLPVGAPAPLLIAPLISVTGLLARGVARTLELSRVAQAQASSRTAPTWRDPHSATGQTPPPPPPAPRAPR